MATAQEFRSHGPVAKLAEQVTASIDAELGILLRCEQRREGRVLEREQLRQLRVFASGGAGTGTGTGASSGAPDAAAFSLPPGVPVTGDGPGARLGRMAGRALGALARAAGQTRRP